MAKAEAFSGLPEWLELQMGRGLQSGVFEVAEDAHDGALLAYRIDDVSMVRVEEGLGEEIRSVVDGLCHDELFSILGAYELSRATLQHGVSVWGPSLYYFGDAVVFTPSNEDAAVVLSSEEVEEIVDKEVFWHCAWEGAVVCFGILEEGRLVALTTVRSFGDPVFEIGVDVAPDTSLRGLGGAVMSAAGNWILEQGGLILARTSQWNIPSARLLRSVGLQYVLCDQKGQRGPFRVPPQPLGKPLPDAEIHDHYPLWAQNKDIIRR